MVDQEATIVSDKLVDCAAERLEVPQHRIGFSVADSAEIEEWIYSVFP